MKARYYTQGFAAAIYADEPINLNDTQLKYFLDELESIPGVEQTQAGKYYVEIAVAYMHDPNEVIKEVLRLFSKIYQTEVGPRISEDERFQKIIELSAPTSE